MVDSFEREWASITIPEKPTVSPALKPLVGDVHRLLAQQVPDLLALKSALERLMSFLASPQGRTEANCWKVDMLFTLSETMNWSELPEDFAEVCDGIQHALHDTVSAPQIAKNFGCLPEQLLERIRNLKT
jgi:hypothetical protein